MTSTSLTKHATKFVKQSLDPAILIIGGDYSSGAGQIRTMIKLAGCLLLTVACNIIMINWLLPCSVAYWLVLWAWIRYHMILRNTFTKIYVCGHTFSHTVSSPDQLIAWIKEEYYNIQQPQDKIDVARHQNKIDGFSTDSLICIILVCFGGEGGGINQLVRPCHV